MLRRSGVSACVCGFPECQGLCLNVATAGHARSGAASNCSNPSLSTPTNPPVMTINQALARPGAVQGETAFHGGGDTATSSFGSHKRHESPTVATFSIIPAKLDVMRGAWQAHANDEKRPPISYSDLTMLALYCIPTRTGDVGIIYSWIKVEFLYYNSIQSHTWKNCVRHNLSTKNHLFRRVGKTPKGYRYTLTPAAEKLVEERFFKGTDPVVAETKHAGRSAKAGTRVSSSSSRPVAAAASAMAVDHKAERNESNDNDSISSNDSSSHCVSSAESKTHATITITKQNPAQAASAQMPLMPLLQAEPLLPSFHFPFPGEDAKMFMDLDKNPHVDPLRQPDHWAATPTMNDCFDTDHQPLPSSLFM
eukprot:m.114859 g.114859  ORF g.114859 m.114859 type:complete len:365 (+) comp16316_c0_seq1:393-1487(+)